MKQPVVTEIIKRWQSLMARATPGDIETGMSGSRIRFDSAMALLGDSNQPPVMTADEYNKNTYDDLLDALHYLAYDKVNGYNKIPPEYFDDVINNTVECIENVKVKRKLIIEESDRKYKEWMKDFPELPKKSKKELQRDIDYYTKRLIECDQGLSSLSSLSEIQKELERLLLDFKRGHYIQSAADKAYKKQWLARTIEFYEQN